MNEAVARLLTRGIEPTKREICDEVGLDYDNADDRARVSNALHKLKESFDYAWREVYVGTGAFTKDHREVSADTISYEKWMKEDGELYRLLQQLGTAESEIHEFWIHSKLWERFVAVANQWNIYIFVAYGQPFVADSWKYKQPSYWDYAVKQIEIARNLGKGVITILERHRDLGMMLISGESVELALQSARDTLLLVADGAPMRHRCELCNTMFRTQRELVEHWQQNHTLPP